MLDERQEEAVKHMEGPCMVLAGPGSGKTTVITGRVKYLIQERGVPEERILVVTFTRAAAREMEERFLRLMGKTRSGVCFGTFHSVFYRILSKASGGKDTVLGPGEQRRLLTEVCRGEKIACNDEEEFLDYVTKEIGKARCRGQIPVEEGVHRIYEKYEELKRREGKIDFDDMMTRTRALLMEREDVLLAWRDAFRFIMIDEFQDINPMQYEIIRLLAAPENNLFIVGDDDQSIYGFRGSDPSIMLHFPEDFPETKTVLLDTNYRCQKKVTELSMRLISHNKERYEKKIRSLRRALEDPVFRDFADFREEHESVIEEIRALLKKGSHYRDFAVLFRTNNEPQILMEAMMKEGIPFRTKEALPNPYRHWTVKDLFAYLELAEGELSRRLLIRVFNRPFRGLERELLSEETVSFARLKERLKNRPPELLAVKKLEKDLDFVRGKPPYAAITYLRRGLGYDDYLKNYANRHHMEEDYLADKIDTFHQAARGVPDLKALKEKAEAFGRELEAQVKAMNKCDDAVTLATLHGAKGLEFKNVFIIDAVDGLMPYRKSVLPAEIEEERRMFYVGVTRAKDRLYLYSVKKLHRHPAVPSPFLEECREGLEN